jgi:NADH:ubiquinone oxidoreductase subunit F (NADH-binding)
MIGGRAGDLLPGRLMEYEGMTEFEYDTLLALGSLLGLGTLMAFNAGV